MAKTIILRKASTRPVLVKPLYCCTYRVVIKILSLNYRHCKEAIHLIEFESKGGI